ncbi:MAG: hypothetical protein ACE5I9_00900 [Candidatus Methylomirabilales bacterium]
MNGVVSRLLLSPPRGRLGTLAGLSGAAVLAVLLALPAPAGAQFDFADALAVKIRTYPVKRQDGRVVPGRDGMPQPQAVRDGRAVGLQELPALPVDENFPGGSILDAFQHYQKRDPLGALTPMLAVLKNGYLELDIEKPCHIDAIKIQYEYQPTEKVPSFQEAGLAAFMQIVADGVMAADLQRAYVRLRDRYNNGLSTDPKGDQDAMGLLQALRLVIAVRYNPRVVTPTLADIPPREAKERFKAEVAKGRPVEANLVIGPLRLAMKAKLHRREKSPPPPGCQGAEGARKMPGDESRTIVTLR